MVSPIGTPEAANHKKKKVLIKKEGNKRGRELNYECQQHSNYPQEEG